MRDGLVRLLAKANHYVATDQRQLCAAWPPLKSGLPQPNSGVAGDHLTVAVAPYTGLEFGWTRSVGQRQNFVHCDRQHGSDRSRGSRSRVAPATSVRPRRAGSKLGVCSTAADSPIRQIRQIARSDEPTPPWRYCRLPARVSAPVRSVRAFSNSNRGERSEGRRDG